MNLPAFRNGLRVVPYWGGWRIDIQNKAGRIGVDTKSLDDGDLMPSLDLLAIKSGRKVSPHEVRGIANV